MAVRNITINARSKDRLSITVRAQIITERGTLSKDEVETMRVSLADALLIAVQSTRYVNLGISEIKVTR